MKKIFILLNVAFILWGCESESYKTTKELCQMPNNSELIQQRIINSQESGLDREIEDALKNRDVEFIKCMIQNNYDEKKQISEEKSDNYSNTLLARSISNMWSVSQVESLIEIAKKDINVPNHNGSTPLMLACHRGNLDLAKLLISKGASINFLSSTDWTPLASAVSSGNLELVKFLIESGAGKKLGISTLTIALRNIGNKEKSNEMANFLLDTGTKYSFEDLVLASERGMLEIVNRLLLLGVEPTADWGTYTPLMAASKGGHTEVLRRLLKTKAGEKYYERRKCNFGYENFPMGLDQAKVENGYLEPSFLANALLYAVQSKNIENTKLLLESGADPNYNTHLICRNDKQMYYERQGCVITPLIVASRYGDKEMIKLLIKYGADINYQCIEYPSLNEQVNNLAHNLTHRSIDYIEDEDKRVIRTAFSEAKNDEIRNLFAELGAFK